MSLPLQFSSGFGSRSESGSRDRYICHCYHCQRAFDAMGASWCNCLGKNRTLICPRCQRCFCKAPAAYLRNFWSGAPSGLWQRKLNGPSPFEPPAHQVAVPEPDPAKPLVLIVEDQPAIRGAAVELLTQLGYRVMAAVDGMQGLALAREHRPSIILTDAMMPKLDGREMCRLLKAQEETRGTKVIIMTALYKSPRYKHEALTDFGADDYVHKPLEFSELETVLRRHAG